MLSGSMLSFDAQGLWESVAQWVGPEVLSKRLSPFLHLNMVTDTYMDTITFFFFFLPLQQLLHLLLSSCI